MCCGLAVVLRRSRNTKALLGRKLRRWRRPCAGESGIATTAAKAAAASETDLLSNCMM
jgi:hypothetical protein